MPYNPALNVIRSRLKREREKTHEFILKCKQEKPVLKPCRPSHTKMLHPERTGGGAPRIDRELEAYFGGDGFRSVNR